MQDVINIEEEQRKTIEESNISSSLLKLHFDEIERELKALGAGEYDMILPETHLLPLLIEPNEIILGFVYGRYSQESDKVPVTGRGLLLATNRRLLLVDHKPLYSKCSEITYQSVSAVSYSRVGFLETITLHARMGNIHIRTANQKATKNLVRAIEANIFEFKELPLDKYGA